MKRFLLATALVGTLLFGGGAEAQQASICNQSAIYDAANNGATQIVAAVPGAQIFICGYSFFAAGTSNVGLVSGTGVNCGTNLTKITPAYELNAQTGMSDQGNTYRGLSAAAGTALCLSSSAGVAVQATVYFTQY